MSVLELVPVSCGEGHATNFFFWGPPHRGTVRRVGPSHVVELRGTCLWQFVSKVSSFVPMTFGAHVFLVLFSSNRDPLVCVFLCRDGFHPLRLFEGLDSVG